MKAKKARWYKNQTENDKTKGLKRAKMEQGMGHGERQKREGEKKKRRKEKRKEGKKKRKTARVSGRYYVDDLGLNRGDAS